jgi:hypothetical protein
MDELIHLIPPHEVAYKLYTTSGIEGFWPELDKTHILKLILQHRRRIGIEPLIQ